MRSRRNNKLIEEKEFAFDIDNESMLRKVKNYLLADPLDYVRELVQMGIQTGATRIDTRCLPWEFSIEDNGVGISQSEIELYLSRVFVSGEKSDMYEGFAMAVISALQTGAEEIVIESRKDDNAVRFTMDRDFNMRFTPSKRRKPGTRISVKYKKSGNLIRKSRERKKVLEYCRYIPTDFRLNGKKLNPDNTLDDVIVQIEMEKDGTRFMLGFPDNIIKSKREIEIQLLRSGIHYDTWKYDLFYDYPRFMNERTRALKARIDSDRFNLNLSRNEIVKDDHYDRILGNLDSCIPELYVKLCEVYPKLERKQKEVAELYIRKKISLLFYAQDSRIGFRGKNDELKEALLHVPIFRTRDGESRDLAYIYSIYKKHGNVPFRKGKFWFLWRNEKTEGYDEILMLGEDWESDIKDIFPLYDIEAEERAKRMEELKNIRSQRDLEKEKADEERKRKFDERYKRYSSNLSPFGSTLESIVRACGRGIGTAGDYMIVKPAKLTYKGTKYITNTLVVRPGKAAAKGAKKGAGYVGRGLGLAATGLVIGIGVAVAPLGLGAQQGGRIVGWAREKYSLLKEEQRDRERKAREREQELREKEKERFLEKVREMFDLDAVKDFLPMLDLDKLPKPILSGRNRNEESKKGPIYLRRERDYDYKTTNIYLVVDKKDDFSRSLVRDRNDEDFEHLFIPVLYQQLLRNDYAYDLKKREFFIEMLESVQMEQMKILMEGNVERMYEWYCSGKSSKQFKQDYQRLSLDMKKELIGKILQGDYSNPGLDHYITKRDNALVEEIGARRVRED